MRVVSYVLEGVLYVVKEVFSEIQRYGEETYGDLFEYDEEKKQVDENKESEPLSIGEVNVQVGSINLGFTGSVICAITDVCLRMGGFEENSLTGAMLFSESDI